MKCKSAPPLSTEERAALDLARAQGGILYRNDIAWGAEDADPTNLDSIIGNSTVKALVARKLLKVTLHERHAGSPRPIEARLVEASP